MGISNARQANAVSRVGRVVDPGAAGKAVVSGDRIMVTAFMNSVCGIKG